MKKSEHDASNIANLRQSFNQFLNEEAGEMISKFFNGMIGKLKKSMPTGSDVHVPSPMGEKKPKARMDSNIGMQPTIDNLEAQILKEVLGYDGNNEVSGFDDMQSIVEGTDWEMENGNPDEQEAQRIALENLEVNPNHYKELMMRNDSTDDTLQKDTRDNQNLPPSEGLNIDIGSGMQREPGYLGLDLYPYDHGTMIHDAHMGLPFPDGSVNKVRLVNSLHKMDELSQDPKPLLSEIHRVMMPGGQFSYEGPNEIYNSDQWKLDYPGFCLVNHTDTEDEVHKDEEGNCIHKQTFTRLATPDPATANDAEPRIGIPQFDALPADALLAIDAVGYSWSDATSSGRGNKIHGYPSQGALGAVKEEKTEKDALTSEGRDKIKDSNFALPDKRGYPIHDLSHARNALARASGKPEESKVRAAVYRKYPQLNKDAKKVNAKKAMEKDRMAKIAKADGMKQIAYCVVLAPNEVDAQNDYMEPNDIEEAAHYYMANQGEIKSQHSDQIDAHAVESYIAPQDFEMDGPYGPQEVKKGSWILGIKVNDPDEWAKVESGEYSGVSVGGMGARQAV